MSGDDVDTLRRFKASLSAPFPFISDERGKLAELFGIKKQFFVLNARTTLVIDTQQKIARIDQGSDAIDPGTAIGTAGACKISKPGP